MEQEGPQTPGIVGSRSLIRFGPYELDLRSAELRKGTSRIRLQDQPFQILAALLERPGEVILREEIRKKLWPDDTVVEFDHSINAAIKRLREALRESADKPRYIETLPRRGYRFIAHVEEPCSTPDQALAGTPATLAADSMTLAAPVAGPMPSDHATRALRERRLRLGVVGFLVLAICASAWYWHHRSTASIRWAREIALPEATRLADSGKNARAFSFILRAQQLMPGDPALDRIRRDISHPTNIRTNPPGASIWLKAYEEPDAPWVFIGASPMKNFLLPLGYFRWKVAKAGFRTVEGAAGFQTDTIYFGLDREAHIPPDMVHVPAGDFRLNNLDPVHLSDYWIGKYEVTNKQFKHFVDQGGYGTRQYWLEEFVRDGRVISWREAMLAFRDATGRPGPSTWELGDYPAGHDDFPVSGVSWYEAAAYSEFAKTQLPTLYHWYRAAGQGIYSDVLFFSNFDSSGPRQVGSLPGLGPFGTYNMAGNVREWCWNATGKRRYIAGGAWNDKRYTFADINAVPPFDRSPANGFRCIKPYASMAPGALTMPVEEVARDYRREKPVSDETFGVIQSLYTYDHTGLNASKESRDDRVHGWTAEKITFDAAYDRQRVIAWLYLPRNAQPPYQTVLYVPPRSSGYLSTLDDFEIKFIEFLVKTGRAVMFPICQGMYDRRLNAPAGPSGSRDRVIQQVKDLRRSLDYLQTRSDIAQDRLGYYGISDGARLGLLLLAQESRITTAVLAAGGFSPEKMPVEIDPVNFAPRVRIPVLMLNGRYDLFYPAETNQVPMFRFLGTPDKNKRYILFDIGHVPFQQEEMKETLDWFDRYLGFVKLL